MWMKLLENKLASHHLCKSFQRGSDGPGVLYIHSLKVWVGRSDSFQDPTFIPCQKPWYTDIGMPKEKKEAV